MGKIMNAVAVFVLAAGLAMAVADDASAHDGRRGAAIADGFVGLLHFPVMLGKAYALARPECTYGPLRCRKVRVCGYDGRGVHRCRKERECIRDEYCY